MVIINLVMMLYGSCGGLTPVELSMVLTPRPTSSKSPSTKKHMSDIISIHFFNRLPRLLKASLFLSDSTIPGFPKPVQETPTM